MMRFVGLDHPPGAGAGKACDPHLSECTGHEGARSLGATILGQIGDSRNHVSRPIGGNEAPG